MRPPSGSTQTIGRLIGTLYDAVYDVRLWGNFLQDFCHQVGGAYGSFVIQDFESPSAGFTLTITAERQLPNATFTQPEFLSHAAPDENPAPHQNLSRFGDWYVKRAMVHSLGAQLCRDARMNSRISILRSRKNRPFADADRKLMDTLKPHLKRSVQLGRKLHRLQLESNAAAKVIDYLPLGLILFGQRGQILLINKSAKMILEMNEGLHLRNNRLSTHSTAETAALHNLMESAKSSSTGGGYVSIHRKNRVHPIVALVTPVAKVQDEWQNEKNMVCVFLSDPERSIETPEIALRRLHGLTAAEAKLTSILVQGKSLEDASAELGITLQTARTHLKKVFAKTETNRQADLVRLLLTGPCALLTPDT